MKYDGKERKHPARATNARPSDGSERSGLNAIGKRRVETHPDGCERRNVRKCGKGY